MIFLKKYFTLLIFATLFTCSNCYAANDALPVLLRVAAAKLDMSRGSNFVQQFDDLIYNEIMQGRARLWDAPAKEIQISAASLKDIEKASGTIFKQQPYIFIYEKWTKATTEIQTVTLGFLFTNKNQKGENVTYGYVEFNDVSAALAGNVLSANADGNCNLKFEYALQAKQFEFSIIQFNGEVITDETGSEKVKKEFVAGFGFNISTFPLQRQVKCITYILEPPVSTDDEQLKLTADIINAIQDFLKAHPVTFSDWGGSLLTDVENPTDILVTRIEVKDMWSKHAGNVTTKTQQVIIFVKGQPLIPLMPQDLDESEMECNGRKLTDVLTEKKMMYYIGQINDQHVERINTFNFLKALQEADWNSINYFVSKDQ